MEWISLNTASEFLEAAEPSLLQSESEHNLLLGLANNILSRRLIAKDVVYLCARDNGNSVGFAIQPDRDNPLVISKMNSHAARALLDYVIGNQISVRAVVGPVPGSEEFARDWQQRVQRSPRLKMHQGVYEISEVTFPEPDGRALVDGAEVDHSVALRFLMGFLADCFPDTADPQSHATDLLNRHMRNGTLFFWKGPADAQPVSMAACVRESRNGATISLVYTPPYLRSRGHASRVVAALSHRCLSSGKKFCNLFTDLKNSTSNHIYQQLGYRKVGESKHFELTA